MTKFRPRTTQNFTRRIPGIVVPVLEEQGRLRLLQKKAERNKTRVAPAFYVGWQEGTTQYAGFPLYTLTEEIAGHSQWSTVSGKTLEDAGFMLPAQEPGREPARSQSPDLNQTVGVSPNCCINTRTPLVVSLNSRIRNTNHEHNTHQ